MAKIECAVISAGGKGTRLQSISGDAIPKPMVPILNKPILQYQLENLASCGVSKVYILIGHLGDVVRSYFGNGNSLGIGIEYIQEDEPLGTGGALFYLKNKINKDFIFIYGDLLLNIDFGKFYEFHSLSKKAITLFSHPNSHPFDSDLLVVNENGNVSRWDSKHNDRSNYYSKNLTNAGLYVVSPKIFKKFVELKKVDFEKDVLIPFIDNNDVASYQSSEYVKDIGTPERYEQAKKDLQDGTVHRKNLSKKQKAIFLDRDGVINKYIGFLTDIDQFELQEDSAEAIKKINQSGYLAIVITNQPVIARGEVTFDELQNIHNKMETLLGKHGAYLDGIYFCPHHPHAGYDGEIKELKIDCDCRKPKTGMLIKAMNDFNINLSECFFIGDSFIDMKTAENAGVKAILLSGGVPNKLENIYHSKISKECINLLDAVNYILK